MTASIVHPIASSIFSGAEIWLILQQLGALAPETAVPPEIASSEAQLAEAKQLLTKRGDITSDPQGAIQLAAAAESLVRPAIFPETACVATIADASAQSDQPRLACFSSSGQNVVINWVDRAQQHHFHAYQRADAPVAIWQYLAHTCDLAIDDQPASGATPTEIERAKSQARQTVLLVQVKLPEQLARALSWFVSDRAAWLIERQESADLPPRRVGQPALSQAVQTFVAQIFG